MEEHISTMLYPGIWGPHIEIFPVATYYNVSLNHSCYNAENGFIGCNFSLYFNGGVLVNYLDISGNKLENIPKPHYFELAYTTNFDYDSITSLTGKLCTTLTGKLCTVFLR